MQEESDEIEENGDSSSPPSPIQQHRNGDVPVRMYRSVVLTSVRQFTDPGSPTSQKTCLELPASPTLTEDMDPRELSMDDGQPDGQDSAFDDDETNVADLPIRSPSVDTLGYFNAAFEDFDEQEREAYEQERVSPSRSGLEVIRGNVEDFNEEDEEMMQSSSSSPSSSSSSSSSTDSCSDPSESSSVKHFSFELMDESPSGEMELATLHIEEDNSFVVEVKAGQLPSPEVPSMEILVSRPITPEDFLTPEEEQAPEFQEAVSGGGGGGDGDGDFGQQSDHSVDYVQQSANTVTGHDELTDRSQLTFERAVMERFNFEQPPSASRDRAGSPVSTDTPPPTPALAELNVFSQAFIQSTPAKSDSLQDIPLESENSTMQLQLLRVQSVNGVDQKDSDDEEATVSDYGCLDEIPPVAEDPVTVDDDAREIQAIIADDSDRETEDDSHGRVEEQVEQVEQVEKVEKVETKTESTDMDYYDDQVESSLTKKEEEEQDSIRNDGGQDIPLDLYDDEDLVAEEDVESIQSEDSFESDQIQTAIQSIAAEHRIDGDAGGGVESKVVGLDYSDSESETMTASTENQMEKEAIVDKCPLDQDPSPPEADSVSDMTGSILLAANEAREEDDAHDPSQQLMAVSVVRQSRKISRDEGTQTDFCGHTGRLHVTPLPPLAGQQTSIIHPQTIPLQVDGVEMATSTETTATTSQTLDDHQLVEEMVHQSSSLQQGLHLESNLVVESAQEKVDKVVTTPLSDDGEVFTVQETQVKADSKTNEDVDSFYGSDKEVDGEVVFSHTDSSSGSSSSSDSDVEPEKRQQVVDYFYVTF